MPNDKNRFEDPLARMAQEREGKEQEKASEGQPAAEEQPEVKKRGKSQRGRRGKKEARFENPLQGKGKEAVLASYTESARAGNYIRHSFTWTPGQLAKIKEIARDLNISMNATARWLMDLGLTAYVEHGVEPELEVKEVRSEPKLREW